MSDPRPPALDPATVEPLTNTGYPEPFRLAVAGRARRRIGKALGLTRFGVNLTQLAPGAASSQRHWHSHDEEFVYVVEGELVLVTDAGEQVLRAGMAAGFPAGRPDGHQLVNRSDRPAVYLEVGTDEEQDHAVYSDIDMECRPQPGGGFAYVHKDGTPW
ncbi:cupin domain-containing protein [Chondromyces crocatus]|uniref:Transcriptional regulator n=1 Tax=Chondromyces crocatus TaxID=52 RepID=A0A0K1EHF6_CHOCO|nr:cupin domain-containing protein [Chondromyces crocatus]AKT40295.1 transcriptional regulator [Chondromyces crocatus]